MDWLAPMGMMLLTVGAATGAWLSSFRDIEERTALRFLADGRPAAAERHFRKALAIMERRFGPQHWRVAVALSSVASALSAQDRLDDADALVVRALAIVDRYEPTPPPSVVTVWLGAARVRRAQERYDDALALIARVKPLLKDPRARADLAMFVLDLYDDTGDRSAAIATVRALDEIDHTLVPHIARVGIGALREGMAQAAFDCFDRALDFVSHHSPGSNAEGLYRTKRAEALVQLGRHEEARADLEKVVEDSERFAPGQAFVVAPLLLLATTTMALGEREAARKACARVLEIARRPSVKESPYRSSAAERTELEDGAEKASLLLETLAECGRSTA